MSQMYRIWDSIDLRSQLTAIAKEDDALKRFERGLEARHDMRVFVEANLRSFVNQ